MTKKTKGTSANENRQVQIQDKLMDQTPAVSGIGINYTENDEIILSSYLPALTDRVQDLRLSVDGQVFKTGRGPLSNHVVITDIDEFEKMLKKSKDKTSFLTKMISFLLIKDNQREIEFAQLNEKGNSSAGGAEVPCSQSFNTTDPLWEALKIMMSTGQDSFFLKNVAFGNTLITTDATPVRSLNQFRSFGWSASYETKTYNFAPFCEKTVSKFIPGVRIEELDKKVIWSDFSAAIRAEFATRASLVLQRNLPDQIGNPAVPMTHELATQFDGTVLVSHIPMGSANNFNLSAAANATPTQQHFIVDLDSLIEAARWDNEASLALFILNAVNNGTSDAMPVEFRRKLSDLLRNLRVN